MIGLCHVRAKGMGITEEEGSEPMRRILETWVVYLPLLLFSP